MFDISHVTSCPVFSYEVLNPNTPELFKMLIPPAGEVVAIMLVGFDV